MSKKLSIEEAYYKLKNGLTKLYDVNEANLIAHYYLEEITELSKI